MRLPCSLKAQYEENKPVATVDVQFTTWASLLQKHHPECQLIKEDEFHHWLKEQFTGASDNVIHYELSLIAAHGAKKYMELGSRQCYFSKNQEVQKKLIDLLARWQEYLKTHKRLDPMVSRLNLPKELKFSSIFCDEAQNLPPVALCDLVEHAEDQHFIACLDNEQCLTTSPYIHSCLKKLMHDNYEYYSEHPLPKTWRCPPKVTEAANVLMQFKYQLDGGSKRRNYHTIESMHATGGLVSWVNNEGLAQVRKFGALAGTVVIAEHLEPGDRKFIINHLGTNNILTAREAIGLDFDRVILWKPLSNTQCFHQLLQKIRTADNSELTLEQWNALNALYVSITRSQSDVFIYETNKNWMNHGTQFFGTLPLNEHSASLSKTELEKERQNWERTVEHHLAEGRVSLAIDLMTFHLHMPQDAIQDKINARSSVKKENNSALTLKPEEVLKQDDSAQKETLKQSTAPAKRKKHKKKNATTTNVSTPLKSAVPQMEKEERRKIDRVLVEPKANGAKQKNVLRIDDYISKLLTNLNEDNINNLFNHKSALHCLFEHQLEDGTCLFTKLINNSTVRNVVLKNIERHWSTLSQNLTPKILCQSNPPNDTSSFFILASSAEGCTLLNRVLINHPSKSNDFSVSTLTHKITTNLEQYHYASAIQLLMAYIDGRKFLIELLKLNPGLAKNLDDDILNSPTTPAGSTIKTTPPVFWLASSPTGIILFKKLLEHNPGFGSSVTEQSLNSREIKPNNSESGASALFWLLADTDGQDIVSNLLKFNPKLAKNITASALCIPLAMNSGSLEQNSALYFLLSSNLGRQLFENILRLNPEIAQGITRSALCRQRIKTVEHPHEFSPLFHAVSCDRGIKALNKLLDLNPDLAKTIGVDWIGHLFNAHDNNFVDPSILFTLSSNPDSQNFLLRLVDANPALIKGITAKALCLPVNIKNNKTYGSSALYWFSSYDSGQTLLNKIWDSNPNLAMEITAKDLFQKMGSSFLFPGTSTLLFLCRSPSGVQCLKKLIELNPKIARGITEDALCSISESQAENNINTSPFYWLCHMSDGRELLNRLLDLNPELGKKITSKILCLARPSHVKALANTAPLFWLLTDRVGISALTKIIGRNPILTSEISGHDLCLVCPPHSSASVNINQSPLFLLAKNNEGQKLLEEMLTTNPELVTTINAHALYLNYTRFNTDYNTSPLYWLCSSALGRLILKNLFNNNPELINQLSSEILTFKGGMPSSKYYSTSALSWLVSCPDGLVILNILLDKKPELAQGISKQFLRTHCAISTIEERRDSPLDLLIESADGRSALNRLVRLNPNLASTNQPKKSIDSNASSVVHSTELSEKDKAKTSQLGIFAHESNNYSTNASQNVVNPDSFLM